MDRIQAMRLFMRIVERGSCTQAARDLQIPRPTVTYAIQELEARLGTRLLERTTRHVSPTLDGSAYYERCALFRPIDRCVRPSRLCRPWCERTTYGIEDYGQRRSRRWLHWFVIDLLTDRSVENIMIVACV
jgi:hypothetical protein